MKISQIIKEVTDAEYSDAEQRYNQTVKNQPIDSPEGKTLDSLIKQSVDGFSDLKGDIEDIGDDLKKAIDKEDWNGVKQVLEYIQGTAKGIEVFVAGLKIIK